MKWHFDFILDDLVSEAEDEKAIDEAELNDEPHSIHENMSNNLPMTSFLSKMARLNSECSNAALQANCLPGQKWRCVHEDGQWRKQKCKFHVSFGDFERGPFLM